VLTVRPVEPRVRLRLAAFGGAPADFQQVLPLPKLACLEARVRSVPFGVPASPGK